jgi:hypothetical protein
MAENRNVLTNLCFGKRICCQGLGKLTEMVDSVWFYSNILVRSGNDGIIADDICRNFSQIGAFGPSSDDPG